MDLLGMGSMIRPMSRVSRRTRAEGCGGGGNVIDEQGEELDASLPLALWLPRHSQRASRSRRRIALAGSAPHARHQSQNSATSTRRFPVSLS